MDNMINEFDELDELIYLSDPETYDLLYLNQCGLEQFGLSRREDINGRKCYQILQGRTEPCEFCTNHLLCEDKFYTWEYQNPVTGGHYLLKDKLVKYQGKPVRMEIAMDITKVTQQEDQIHTMLANELIAMDCARCLMSGSGSERQAVRDALALLGSRLAVDRAYIFELRGKSMNNTYEWCAPGISEELDQLQDIPVSVCHQWIRNFLEKKPYVITNVEARKNAEPEAYEYLKNQTVKCLIAVPLFEKDTLVGFLGVDNPPLSNGSNIVEILQLLSYFIQETLTRAKSNERLRQMTFFDEMTGAKNRNAFIHSLETLNAELHGTAGTDGSGRQAKADGANAATGYGAVFVDVNGLKETNDTVGHDEGDRLLVRVAQKIMRIFPAADVYRTGGDEFVVLCTRITEAHFIRKTGLLKQQLDGKQDPGCSASIGVSWTSGSFYMEEIINQAEADMYEAKRQYYISNMTEDRRSFGLSGMSNAYTSLLLRDANVAGTVSELIHIIMEHWNPERIADLLDEDFTLFEGEYQKVYHRREAIQYLERLHDGHKEQQLRDLQLIRKRIIRGISIFSCYGRIDWKADNGQNFSNPFEMTLLFVQRRGQIRCLYMHCTDLSYQACQEQNIGRLQRDTLMAMIARTQRRQEVIEAPENAADLSAAFRILADAFHVVSLRYSNVYFVDIHNDSYVSLKTEGKFHSLVGMAGSYTGINEDYADRYMDEATRIRYLDFTSRRNLLKNLEKGNDFLQMSFSVTRDQADQDGRDVDISIWLGFLEDAAVGVFAYRNVTGIPQQPVEKDSLTGLLSYEKFRREGQMLLDGGGSLAVVSADIQNFKYINEVLGYQEGDFILKAYADSLPPMEQGHVIHTRVTADLFLTVLVCPADRDGFINGLEQNLCQFCLLQKQRNEDIQFVMRAGVYFPDSACARIDTAIDRANITRKSIGQSIVSEVCIYGEEILKKDTLKNQILAGMGRALENGDFQVWLQPIVRMEDQSLCGAEALVRWIHDGNVYSCPDDFIPIFEGNGFITCLDFYVLEEVCHNLNRLKTGQSRHPFRISVNLSAVDLEQPGIVDSILNIVDRCQADHADLEFELTETAYFTNSSSAVDVIKQLKDHGFATSVDDFGTGYSVMNMLINIPANVVKIDRSFMVNSQKTGRGRAFLAKLVGMIHELDYRVLCEGIETQEQYQLLKEIGCDEGQGFYFSRPVPMDVFLEKYCGEQGKS